MILATMTEYPLNPSSMATIWFSITLVTGIVCYLAGYVAGFDGGREDQLKRDVEQLERELIHQKEEDSDER